MAEHNDLGKLGEDLAVEFLQQNGFEVLHRNWVFQKAELDIVAVKNNILAIVEVKTRSSNDFGLPQDFVKPAKIKLLVKAVDEYVNVFDRPENIRFDIIAISKLNENFTIEHLEDAFFYF
ncbi:endonuclease [Flavobacterium sp. NST-5]|uniref:UPF0102 protein GV828_07300 n=1 Tax=Flavobacterium ichthyis TaxID=2698827 RepID=A0ABW9Z7Z8_9FLAO|nr:YraN family protein [Flavobacterium ichthyis]NBL65003.1 endonuclease [Flavobacterium ichthyis]